MVIRGGQWILLALLVIGSPSAFAQSGRPAHVRVYRWTPDAAEHTAHRAMTRALEFVREGHRPADAASLLRNAARPVSPDILPSELPPLPHPRDPELIPLFHALPSATNPRQQYLYLERQAAILRGSSHPAERERSIRLRDYLSTYKSHWAAPWLATRQHRFHNLPVSSAREERPLLAGISNTDVAQSELAQSELAQSELAQSELAQSELAQVRQRLDEAIDHVTGLVHGSFLLQVPALRVRIGRGRSIGISRSGQTFFLDLNEQAGGADVAHEVGHMLENMTGLGTRALAFDLLRVRADGRYPAALTEVAGHPLAFPGGFVDPYMGRYYEDGFTEIISMGIERLFDDRAMDFFHADGDYVLRLLDRFQAPAPAGEPMPR